MVFQYDVADCNVCIVSVATEVEYNVHTVHIDTSHVALVEYILLISLQLDSFSKEEGVVVAFLSEFNSYIVMVSCRHELAAEVIV